MNYVEVSGARIRYHETGPAGGPPIVLLHGIGRSLEDWELQHSRLPSTHRIISLDMPGFGLSQRLAPVISLGSLADGVWATLSALSVDRPADLMGNSLGGAVAMRMTVDEPDRVRTLTLVNSAGFGRTVTAALRILALPGVGRPLLRRMADPRIARRTERSIFFDGALVTRERIETAVKIARQPDFAAVYLQAARALGGVWGVAPAWRRELLPQVARLEKPTLLVWGSRDLILPSAHLAAARLAFPSAQSHLFPDTGHMPQIERPDEFAALVRPFLEAY
ncbi:alpha/beta fold hydrolase [Actinoplanes sp. NPDC051343]|uniref:alpha/beta fold hydrolase n=1 Tax=Actinoplanes sp. NPDC051343 TaxID=3363906 RepID=UPI0037980669